MWLWRETGSRPYPQAQESPWVVGTHTCLPVHAATWEALCGPAVPPVGEVAVGWRGLCVLCWCSPGCIYPSEEVATGEHSQGTCMHASSPGHRPCLSSRTCLFASWCTMLDGPCQGAGCLLRSRGLLPQAGAGGLECRSPSLGQVGAGWGLYLKVSAQAAPLDWEPSPELGTREVGPWKAPPSSA